MFQFLTKLDYLLRETFLGLRRGGWMNWAAISTVTVLLFLFGVSLQTSWHLEGLLNRFGSQLEVSVYLETGIQATDLKPTVQALPEVAEVLTIPKEQAWTNLIRDLGISDIHGATKQLEGNPLVDELKVKAKSPENVPTLAQKLSQMSGVDEVQYVDEAVKRVAQLNQGLSWISLTMITLLTLTAIAVITTTIRLIVMARRREIEVMQLVGATTSWIYLPFILQGVAFGLAGAAIAWGLIASIQHFLTNLLAQQPEFVQFLANGLRLSPWKTVLLPLILLGFGSSVGIMGSLFAVRRIALR
ncbi:ABC transporter permease [Leptothermofonsia sichuanensis E412]|uniref:cell division protein FtsX n=1 Tax=Leptothermofonsia sichuanensis TaxID=2917832 RepID=UPI001CA692C3|nr:ABC transporter permease [Leptothermofonsia sichuanensis]QZZ19449.1 ABC transporter permease [Leptothermofonsia sichuanensis E412]